MRARPINFSPYRSEIIELRGGVNENVSSIELQGGELIDCKNYMIAEGDYGGYKSVKGFERFDGIILPSTFESYVMRLENCATPVVDGDTITGSLSGATAVALDNGSIVSGSYLAGDAVVIVQAAIDTGTFTEPEELTTINGTVGDLVDIQTIVGGTDEYNVGIKYARENVLEVPGEGPILGLHVFNGLAHVFRKKVGVNFIGFYKEDPSTGWAEIDTTLNPIVYDGTTGHSFRFTDYNFYGSVYTSGSKSMYWCDGVNKARGYDGSTVILIDNSTMDPDDKPINIIAHNFYLILAYRGGYLVHSVLGDPENWDPVLGASDLAVGDEITNLISGVQSALIIFMKDRIDILHGTVYTGAEANANMETFSPTSGSYKKTAQRLLGTIFFVDDRGVTTLEAVQQFGDYAANSISQKFKQTLLSKERSITTTLTSRDLNQYRIFFDDRTAIFVSFEGKEVRGATFIEYTKPVIKASQGKGVDKRDISIFADDTTGFVYKMDSGTSFDGDPITCRLSTPFYHYRSPRQNKGFKRATLEITGENNQNFYMKVDFNYNELGSPATIWYRPYIYTTEGGAVYGSGIWGEMKYGVGQAATNRVPLYLQGVGTNMSYKIISNETYRPQHIIQNIITDYEPIGRRV